MKISKTGSIHKPVLLKQAISLLKISEGTYIDLTLGGGGHFNEILKRIEKGILIGFDVDKEAIDRIIKYLLKNNAKADKSNYKLAIQKFKLKNIEIYLINENFEKLLEVLDEIKIKKINGILVDLGLSSDEIEEDKRGFSYRKNTVLDMRMDQRLQITAKDLINILNKKQLIKIFRENDEYNAVRIAEKIIDYRDKKQIETTFELKTIIKSSFKKSTDPKLLNKPVARVFQALRIAVNSEINSLRNLLPQLLETLIPGSRFVIISFHSGEDRVIKHFFKLNENLKKIKILTEKPLEPKTEEIFINPRARSAKLRAFEKI